MLDKAELVLVGANDTPWYLWDQSSWYGTMGLHGVFWLALMALVITTVLVLSRTAGGHLIPVETSPRAALDGRYARGGIDRGDYLERKRDLL